jgi:O-antigen/teichoic acid export membrane protein
MNNLYKKISLEIGFSYLMKAVNVIISFLFFIFITRLLSNEEYGVYALFIATSNILFNIFRFRLTDFFIKDVIALEKKDKIKKIATVFQTVFVFDAIILLALFALQSPFLKLLKLQGYAAILLIVLLIVFMRIMLNQISTYFMTEKRITSQLILSFFVTPFGMLVVILFGLIFQTLTVDLLFVILFLTLVVVLVGAYTKFFLKEKTFLLKPVKFDISYIKEAMIYTLPLLLLSASQWVITTIDRYFLAAYYNLDTVSAYSYTYSLLSQLMLISAIIPNTLYPYLSEYWSKKDKAKYKLFFNLIIKYSYLLIIPALTGFVILGEEIITMFSGPKYINSVALIPFLIAFPLLQIAIYIFQKPLLLKSRTYYILFISIVGMIVNIVLNWLLIPNYSYYGAAIATIITYIVMVFLFYFGARKNINYKNKIVQLHKIVLSTVIMGLAIAHINPESVVPKVLTIGLGGAIYVVSLFLTRTFKREEIKVMKNLFWRS